MTSRSLQVRGRPDEFEAAVVAVVIDRIAAEERAAEARRREQSTAISPWVRAIGGHDSLLPQRDLILPS